VKEIAEALEPLSEEQLDSIYRGLLAAPPHEILNPGIAAPYAPLLADPVTDRQSRFKELSQRLAQLEGQTNEEEQMSATSSDFDVPADSLQEEDSIQASAAEPGKVLGQEEDAPKLLLRRLVVLSGNVDLSAKARPEELEAIPLGLAVLSEWKDLVLACVSLSPHGKDLYCD
jgi:hypothetical protein